MKVKCTRINRAGRTAVDLNARVDYEVYDFGYVKGGI